MPKEISRRAFLKLGGLSTAAAAFRPPPPISGTHSERLARIASTKIGLYTEPSFRADLLTYIERDNLLPVTSQETSDEGPPHNPLWYRVPEGYIHSGNVQLVEWHLQSPRWDIPDAGAVFEVTVPFTRVYQSPDPEGMPLYRLYYQANAWATKLVKGEDGRYWYRLVDDLLNIEYYARAEHLRRVEPEELTPISPEIPQREKRIEVSLSRQEMMAFERDKLVFRTRISSGIPSSKPGDNGIPTATPKGRFYVDKKMPLRHMGDGRLTANLEAYELPGVPWVSYFHLTGIAFHGTYWHCDYGRPRSHGCVNMRPEEAKWIFRWTEPVTQVDQLLQTGYGTHVVVY